MTGDETKVANRLNDEALSDLNLSQDPFTDDRKREHYNDSISQSIRSEIEQQLRHGDALHLLLGPSGSGKSVSLSQLVKHNKDYVQPYIARGDKDFEARAFLAAILQQFEQTDIEPGADHVAELLPHLQTIHDDQRTVTLVIDNAQEAPIEEIAELIGLLPTMQQANGEPLVKLLLTGEASLQDELTAISEELEVPAYKVTTVPALSVDRTREYLNFRLNQVGFTGEFPFTDSAVTRIQQNSGGLPAQINTCAAAFLNKVYTGAGAATKGGLIATLGWPVIGMGAAALAFLIAGISMFSGGSEDTKQPTIATSQPAASSTNTVAASASTATVNTIITAPNIETNTDGNAQPNDDLLRPEHRSDPAGTVDSTAASVDSGNTAPDPVAATSDTDTQTSLAIAESATQPQPQPQPINSDTTLQASTAESTVQDAATNATDATADVANAATSAVATTTENATLSTTQAVNQATSQATETITQAASVTANSTTNAVAATATGVANSVTQSTETIQSVQAPQTQPTQPNITESVQVAIPAMAVRTSNEDGVSVVTSPGVVVASPDGNGVSVSMPSSTGSEAVAVTISTDSDAVSVATDADTDDGVAIGMPGDTIPAVEVVTAPSVIRAVENERWILFQPDSKFTLQLATSRERGYIMDLAQTLNVEGPLAVYPFIIKKNGRQVYGLLNGLFDSTDEAMAAIDQMPPETRKFKPWIRPIKQLQDDIKASSK